MHIIDDHLLLIRGGEKRLRANSPKLNLRLKRSVMVDFPFGSRRTPISLI
jgi:hypothetical protein